jgi:hypothetical protein
MLFNGRWSEAIARFFDFERLHASHANRSTIHTPPRERRANLDVEKLSITSFSAVLGTSR